MLTDEQISQLQSRLQLLADATRLRILGLLAERDYTGGELAAALGLTAPTVSHHLAKLVDAGIVKVTPDKQRRIYRLDQTELRATTRSAQEVAASDESVGSEVDKDERRRRQVIAAFFEGERLKSIPAQRRKRVIVLLHLLERFDPQRIYQEREVNDLLRLAHDDVATLRRELVDYGFMQRSDGIYSVAHAPPERSRQVRQEMPVDEAQLFRAIIDRSLGTALREGAES